MRAGFGVRVLLDDKDPDPPLTSSLQAALVATMRGLESSGPMHPTGLRVPAAVPYHALTHRLGVGAAVKVVVDCEGRRIRLTDERLTHIGEHPEMVGLERTIEDVLRCPEQVVESLSDPQVRLYYRWHVGTRVGDKYLCVVVKLCDDDGFMLTAYLTDTVKKGRILWPAGR